ncbi:hypothetical protein COCSADRAFT_34206, partial [Bipolaris sorokiniana ND90Pr]
MFSCFFFASSFLCLLLLCCLVGFFCRPSNMTRGRGRVLEVYRGIVFQMSSSYT